MAVKIPKLFGWGQGYVSTYLEPNLKDFLDQIADDLADVKAIFDAHKHSIDGTALGAVTDITGGPVTGTTTGTPTGGTATVITIGLEKE